MAAQDTVVNLDVLDLAHAGWAMNLVQSASNLFTICVDNRIEYINPAGVKLLCVEKAEDVLNQEFANFIHPDYREYLAYGLDVLAEEDDFIPVKMMTVCGEEIDAKLLINELQIKGRTAYIVEVLDITAYKKASEAVRDREHRIKSILNTVSEGIITFGQEGIIQTFNPAAEKVFGCPASDMLGQHVVALMPEERQEKFRRIFSRKVSHGQSNMMGKPMEVLGWNREKGKFPLEITISSTQVGHERIFTAVLRDITERVQTVERIRHLAHHDTLTGLPNRHLFTDRLNHAIKLSRRYDHALVLMFIDLDKFKPINDTLGHEAGDVVLIEVARRFLAIVRESDTVARIGGDEFVILLEELENADAGPMVAEKILESLQVPIKAGGRDCYLGASIGMACFPDDTMDAEELMRYADEAMYAVKTSGRNDYRRYDNKLSILGN